jgi:hypothetical protein
MTYKVITKDAEAIPYKSLVAEVHISYLRPQKYTLKGKQIKKRQDRMRNTAHLPKQGDCMCLAFHIVESTGST